MISEVADYLEHLKPPQQSNIRHGYRDQLGNHVGSAFFRVEPRRRGAPKVVIDGNLHRDEWPELPMPLPLSLESDPVLELNKKPGIRLEYPSIFFKCTQDIDAAYVTERVNVAPGWNAHFGVGDSWDYVIKRELGVSTGLDQDTLKLRVYGSEQSDGLGYFSYFKVSHCLILEEPARNSLKKAVAQVLADLDL